jgi:F0F1-type ATP synthase assembly protein I
MGLALMYLAVSAAGVRGLWSQVSHAKLLVAAAVGVAVSAGAVFGNVYQAASPLNTVPWALLVWVVLGTAWSFVALRRPARHAYAAQARSHAGGTRP